MNSKDMRTIKSAHRVLEILEYFDREHRTATVMDLSRSLEYPPIAVSRHRAPLSAQRVASTA